MITTFVANKNSKRKHWDSGATISVFFVVKFHNLAKIIIIIIKEKNTIFLVFRDFVTKIIIIKGENTIFLIFWGFFHHFSK